MALQVKDTQISVGSDDITDANVEIQRMLMYAKDADGHKHPVNTDTNGHLKITIQDSEVQRSVVSITTDFSGTALSGSLSDATATAYWDAQNFTKFQLVISGTNGGFGSVRLQASNTTTGSDFVDIQEIYEETLGTDYLFKFRLDSACPRYYRILNSSGSAITFSKIQIFFVK